MTPAEAEAGNNILKEIDEIQRKINLIEDNGMEISLNLQASPISIDLGTGYSIAEITEVVRARLIVERSLKQTELANL